MLTFVLCTPSIRHCTTFSAGNALFSSTKSNFSEVSLVYCSLWSVIQQRVYQPQLYSVDELKSAYGAAQ